MLNDPEIHIKRGLNQLRLEREHHQRQWEEEERLGIVRQDPEEQIKTDRGLQRRYRLSTAMQLLSQSFLAGGFAGFILGSIYAFRTRHPNPAMMGLTTAASMGLLAGQFAGFRYLMPEALQRHYQNYTRNPNESDLDRELREITEPSLLDTLWIGTNEEPPAFLRDWTPKDTEIVQSALAGGLAGYFTNRFQAVKFADSQRLLSLSPHSAGVRGAVFWSLFFGVGQIGMHWLDDVRRRHIAKRQIQQLYISQDQDALMNMLPAGVEQVPERSQVVDLPWSYYIRNPIAFFQEHDMDWSWVLPFVHEKEAFEYRQYLESKERLLEDEVGELKRLKRQLEKREPVQA